MTRHYRIHLFIAALLILVSASSAWSSNQPGNDNLINKNTSGVAIKGYDPVAYFVDSRPTPGNPKLSHQWNGATWYFSNKQNQQRFIKEPTRYAPQYGGYCAYAASVGQLADFDPQSWSVINNKLYLNFSPRVRGIWRPRAQEFIGDANQLWPTIKK